MSLVNLLKKKINIDSFTTPSHSQKFFVFPKLRQFYKYDISETDAHNPQAAINSSQERASEIYGTKSTYFLTNGSTSGVIAAVLACVSQGDAVLVWRDAHSSHGGAVKLAGASPVFYDVDKDDNWGIYTSINPTEIENKLNQEKIKAVIVTSPTYEGVVSDIPKIKEICKKYGAYLIVDEAHGALYPFCEKLPTSAIYSGADFVIQSLHKTAGGLNPTALLHCNVDLDVQSALDLITTTSPSYPLLASVEKNITFLNSKRGRKYIIELIENIENLKKNVNNCEFYDRKDSDPTKILVRTPSMSGQELSQYLYQNNIEDEKTNTKSTMLLCGIGTDLKKLKKLERVLRKI